MKRRNFIKTTSLIGFGVSAFGFTKWNGKKFVGSTPTTTDILGPFYRPGAPLRSNIIPAGSKGIPLNFSGIIFKDDGKTPLKNALVEIWQCDEKEVYDNTSDDYRFRGAVKTGKNGRYEFKTIVPVPYKANPDKEDSWRPAHIHMRVSSDQQQDLISQIYIQGDKYNKTDTYASSQEAINRILSINKNAANENELKFDVVMDKSFPLSEEAFKKIAGIYKGGTTKVEFIKNDDLLYIKMNGQLAEAVKYIGNNTFKGATMMVAFELMPAGDTKVIFKNGEKTLFTGNRIMKY